MFKKVVDVSLVKKKIVYKKVKKGNRVTHDADAGNRRVFF